MTWITLDMKRMRLIAALFCSLFVVGGIFAQQTAPLGTWTPYVSYSEVMGITKRGDMLFVISQGGLFSYDLTTQEIRAFSTTRGLSGVSPSTIYGDTDNNLIFIGYQDGSIDYFNDPDNIGYITDIERSSLFPTKAINQFTSQNNLIYIATDFGVVVYDIAMKETRSSYTKIGNNDTGIPIYDVIIHKGKLWVAMGDEGLYYAELTHPNLADPAAWNRESGSNGLSEGYTGILAQTGNILYTVVGDTLFQQNDSLWVKSPLGIQRYGFVDSNEDILTTVSGSITTILYPDSSVLSVDNGGGPNATLAHDNVLWIGDRSGGLVRWEAGNFESVLPAGPNNNFVTRMVAANGELYIAPRGKDGPSGRYGDQSGNSYYSTDFGWKINDLRNNRLTLEQPHRDFARAHYDPATGHAYLGSWGDGIMEYYLGDTVRSYTMNNSGLGGFTPNDMRISGLDMDRNGNLWVSHVFAQGDEIMNVKTPDDQWYAFKASSFLCHDIMVDDFNNKWLLSEEDGVIVFNENQTFTDLSDDEIRRLSTAQGNGGLPNLDILSGVVDLDGNVWLGTSSGVVVFYDPGSVFTTFFQDASCPIFNGRCLLKDQPVNTIAIDGANRKWIGTNDGVYLLSEDGTDQILRFTTENSPLLSNTINNIAIDGSTGEVFIGTEDGIISYMGDAISGEEVQEELTVFPNPVYSDYEGLVTIRGSVAGSAFKITSVSGQLVREVSSNGGQAVWDGRDLYGNKVASGVYLVMVADQDGENAGIAKIAFINRD